jgi:hypothetical protein
MPYTCPKCDRELTSESQRHYCARISLDDLFKGKPDELLLLFDKLLAEVADWPDVLVGPPPTALRLCTGKPFLLSAPCKRCWILSFIRLPN